MKCMEGSEEDMSIQAGQTLLHYRLIAKIGEGGMGAVWKAEDTKLHRNVALKVLPESMAADPERLFAEQAVGNLHPAGRRRQLRPPGGDHASGSQAGQYHVRWR